MSRQNHPGRARGSKSLGILTLAAFAVVGWTGAPAQAQESSPFDIDRADAQSEVSVSEYMTVELHVQDEALSSVLQLLSLQSQRNIVVSNDVSATVTADLYGVTFYEALDAILHVNGYGYIERGNFIFVYTLDEIAQIEAADRRPIQKVIRLNYLNATDAAAFVEPLLSEIGQIRTNGNVEAFSIPDSVPIGDETFALSATMVVSDYPEHVEEIERLVMELDTKPAQVLVEATILQTQLNEANAFGVDFSIIGDVDFTDFINTGGPLSAANALQAGGDGSAEGLSPADNNGLAGASTPGGTGGASTFKIGVVQDDFSVFMRLLDEVTDFTVLSNPKILALNRQPARVLVGRRLGYLNTTSTETSTTQSVEFLDTGTQLSFRPFISKDGMIRLELNPRVSEGFIRESVDDSGVAVSIPDEVTQELTTNVIVRDGSTVVLGGLFKETTTLTRKQVPILGDIPIVGAAFRGHDDSIDRNEIIFLITPTIVNDAMLADHGEEATEFVENVRTGSRMGLLPWSREKMTAQLNVEAERLAIEGNVDGALWRLRRSLELNPVQPEVINLRERLVKERDRWPSRSILDAILADYGAGDMRREAEAMRERGEVDEWVDPDDKGPVPGDPHVVNREATPTRKLSWSDDELRTELERVRAEFETPTDDMIDAETAATLLEDEYLFEEQSHRDFGALPGEGDPMRQGFDPESFEAQVMDLSDSEMTDLAGGDTERPVTETPIAEDEPMSDASDAGSRFDDEPSFDPQREDIDETAEATFGSNIVEFFNGEPDFAGAGQAQIEDQSLADSRADSPEAPYFVTFDHVWSPFSPWITDHLFGTADENGLPVVDPDEINALAFEEGEDEPFESGSMEDSTYSTLVELLDKMFEPNPESSAPDSEIAEVETGGDDIDQ